MNDMNMALKTLLDVAKEIEPDIPEWLIEKAYLIQKEHQFETIDRTAALQDLQMLLESYVTTLDEGRSL